MKKLCSLLSIVLITSMFTTSIFAATTYTSGEETIVTKLGTGEKEVTFQQLDDDNNFEVVVKLLEYNIRTATVDNESYSCLSMPGGVTYGDVGKPALPIKTIMLELDKNATPEVSLKKTSTEKLNRKLNIFPNQPIVRESSNNRPADYGKGQDLPTTTITEAPITGFQKDEATYKNTSLYPQSALVNQEVIYMRNHKVLKIDISPFQVIPATQEAQFSKEVKLNIKLDYNGAEPISCDSPLANESYDKAVIGNKILYISPKYLNRPLSQTTVPGIATTTVPIYMIIMNKQFEGNAKLNEFIQWKREKGYDVRVKTTEQINKELSLKSGIPEEKIEQKNATADELVTYMRGLDDDNYPDYLLLIGDRNQATGVQTSWIQTQDRGWYDLDLSLRTTDDIIPDVYCGRIPAYNTNELTTMLTKVLNMDKNPPKSDMYDKVLVASTIQDNDPKDNQADRLFCETADAIATYYEKVKDEKGNLKFSCTRAIVNPDEVNKDCLWQQRYPILWKGATGSSAKIGSRVFNTFVTQDEAQKRINDSINNGTSIVFARDHGNYNGWVYPKYTSDDVNNLKNGNNTPLVLSVCCLAGAYHKDKSFVRSWFRNPDSGAYAFIGAVDASPSEPNDWFAHGLNMAINSDYTDFHIKSTDPIWITDMIKNKTKREDGTALKLGEMFTFARMYMYDNCDPELSNEMFHLYNLFGDPESEVQLHKPVEQKVTYPETVNPGTEEIVINTGEANSLVTLYGDSSEEGYIKIHSSGLTDKEGKVTFNVKDYTKNSGKMHLTVTKNGKIPFCSTIQVYAPKLGDLNDDGDVDSADYSWLRGHLLKVKTLPSKNWRITADLNLDGMVDSADYSILRGYLIKKIPSLPYITN